MIEISIYLFGKPGWEMNIEGLNLINPDVLRIKGDELKERLERAADVVEKLQNNKWILWGAYGDMYGLDFFRDDIESVSEARTELVRLGIDLEKVDVHELME